MYPRILNSPLTFNQSFFLFGPRGTGKTTWLKTQCSDIVYFDLLDSALHQKLLAEPSRLDNLIPLNNQKWIVIDEIQKNPDLLNEVHRLIEAKKYRFILTGSSARSLRKKGVNLLGGRALNFNMHPLTAHELAESFDLDKSLKFGNLPMVYNVKSPEQYLASYIGNYLIQEVQIEGLTRNLGSFSKFLEVASFSQSAVLNTSEIAREIGLDRKTIENYFTIIEDLLIADRIPVFTKKAKRRMIVHPKFFFFDTGVFKALRPMAPLDRPEEAEGAALETLFYQELKALNDYFNLGYKIFYWRTTHGEEIDFVIYGPRGLKAFEIKRSRRFSSKDLSNLKIFLKDYEIAETYFLYGGDSEEHYNGIRVIPYSKAIRNLKEFL